MIVLLFFLAMVHVGKGEDSCVTCGPPDAQPFSQIRFVTEDEGQSEEDPSPQCEHTRRGSTTGGVSRDFAPGDVVVYVCDPGYVPADRNRWRRRCQQDGTWSYDAPSCYLNMVEQSNLTVTYPRLVDGNFTTYETFEDAVEAGFYHFPWNYTGVNAHEVRIVMDGTTSSDWADWAVRLKYDGGSTTEIGVKDFLVQVFDTNTAFSGVFNWHKSMGRLVGLVLLPKTARPETVNIHELQMIYLTRDGRAKDDGVSVHQCQLSSPPAGLLRSWTDGELCFHLVEARENGVQAEQAEKMCQSLAKTGRLARVNPNLHSVIQDILSLESRVRKWSSEHILVAGRKESGTKGSRLDDEWPRSWLNITRASFEAAGCAILKQVAKWYIGVRPCEQSVNMFICQTDPQLCGSPGRLLGARYDPDPRPDSRVINVTCAHDTNPSGQIRCQNRRWSAPDFCQTDRLPLWPILGGAAAAVLLCCVAGCLLHRRRRRNADDGPDWVSYGFMERLRRKSLSSRRLKRHQDTAVDEDHIYSEMIYADSGFDNDSQVAGSREKVRSWLHGPGAEPTADRWNTLYESNVPATVPLAEYSTPIVKVGRADAEEQLPAPPPGDTTGIGGATPADEYAVPWDVQTFNTDGDVPKIVVTTVL